MNGYFSLLPFFSFLEKALLRYIYCIIHPFEACCSVGLLISSQIWAIIFTVSFRTFSSPPKEGPLAVTPNPSPPTPALLSVSGLPCSRFSREWNSYSMWSYVSGLFHLACFHSLSVLQYISVLHSFFLWLNNIPSRGQTTFCLSIHLLINI
uniref:Uncharacterized protein n=1 Tax=Rousettus aegyptiacus TaxID=9407 RepID=A0A7J8HS38_ROUAE|nr:hypothetical protein HJG63_010885 [Rousettus aegyptiacus]